MENLKLSLSLWNRINEIEKGTLKEKIINVATDIDDKFNCDIPLTETDKIIYQEIKELGIY